MRGPRCCDRLRALRHSKAERHDGRPEQGAPPRYAGLSYWTGAILRPERPEHISPGCSEGATPHSAALGYGLRKPPSPVKGATITTSPDDNAQCGTIQSQTYRSSNSTACLLKNNRNSS